MERFLISIYIKLTTMKKLFLFILILIGLSSCVSWDVSTTPYMSYDYRTPYYNPHYVWTDMVYTNYYSRYGSFNFGYSSYYGFYGYYGYYPYYSYNPYYDYYNYYGLYNYQYHKHYNYNNYAYTYPQKKVVNKPVYRRSTTSVSSRVEKPKTYTKRRDSYTPSTNGRTTNRYTNSPTRQRTNTRSTVRPSTQRTNTRSTVRPTSRPSIQRTNTRNTVRPTSRPSTQRSTNTRSTVRPTSRPSTQRSTNTRSTVRPAPSRSRSTPVKSTTKRKN